MAYENTVLFFGDKTPLSFKALRFLYFDLIVGKCQVVSVLSVINKNTQSKIGL